MADEKKFDPEALTKGAEDTFTVRRVFGEAYEREGVLVVPVAKLRGVVGTGAGGGEGSGFPMWGRWVPGGAADEPADVDPDAPGATGHGEGHGGGGGYGVIVRPLGVYVIDGQGARFRPAVDVNRMILGAQVAFGIVASVAFLAAAVRRR